MLLMSRNYALAAEEEKAKMLLALEPALLTPEERAAGKRLAPRPEEWEKHFGHPYKPR